MGTGAEHITIPLDLYIGIRLNNAAVGIRAGYYTFGYHAVVELRL
jgi:hypothetical protein